MAKTGLVITGIEEFEGNLTTFEKVAFPAEIRKGTRDAAKLVLEEYKARVPVKSGSMRDAAVVRAVPRSRVKIGHTVKILRDRLFQLYEARTGKPPASRKQDDEPFFYPTMIELGAQEAEAQRPLRGALYDNEQAVMVEFSAGMLRAINHPKIKLAA